MPRYRIVPKTPHRAPQRREETAMWIDVTTSENYYRGARGQFQRCDFTIARCPKCLGSLAEWFNGHEGEGEDDG